MRSVICSIFAIVVIAMFCPSVSAVGSATQNGDFGVKSPKDVLSLASSFYPDSVTDYYFVSYYVQGDLSRYNILYFNSSPVTFPWGNEFSNSYSNGYSGQNVSSVELAFTTNTGDLSSRSMGGTAYCWLYNMIDNGVISYYNNVEIIVKNNNDYNISPVDEGQGDSFFCSKDNYTINFGVYAGPSSSHLYENGGDYFATKQYNCYIVFEYNGSSVSYLVPNYMAWYYKYNTYVQTENVENTLQYLPKYIWYCEPFYSPSYMQGFRALKMNEPSLFPPLADFEAMIDYKSFNQITLSQLLNALSANYPNMTINDLYTDLHFRFFEYGTDNIAYEKTIDYSSLHNSGVVPVDDPTVTDLTDSNDDLNKSLVSNNNYLKNILYGDTYTPQPYETTIKDAGNINLDTLSIPDFTYNQTTLDTSATSFFGRMVEWWYLDTPFGIIAIVALTFLVVRTILW